MVATVCSQWADSWKSLGRKLPLRVRAQRQRRDEQALAGAVADPQCYFPRRVRELQCYARWNLPLDLALELAGQFWLWNQGNFPISLKFRSLFYDCDEEKEMIIKLTSQLAFDFWTCKEAESLLSERLRIQNPFMWPRRWVALLGFQRTMARLHYGSRGETT